LAIDGRSRSDRRKVELAWHARLLHHRSQGSHPIQMGGQSRWESDQRSSGESHPRGEEGRREGAKIIVPSRLMASRILLLTGMTPDHRIFDRMLPLLPNASVVPWIAPRSYESIPQYAARLASTLSPTEDCVICGVSFGGIVARELAHQVSAKCCIQISSIRDSSQLPPWFRLLRGFSFLGFEHMLAVVGQLAVLMPRRVRTRSTSRLTKLAGPKGAWHRWATTAVLRWKARIELDSIPLVQIHGDSDSTFPVRYVSPNVVISSGGHVLPLTHANQIASIIASLIKSGRIND
jgi:pimeloyl-ACP methyl ester carboxylesterase